MIILTIVKGKPDPPSKPTVSDIKATQISICWTPPTFDGGTPIISYLVEYKAVSSTEWIQCKLVKSTETTILVNDLQEKTQYQFRVSAENQVGLGSYSTSSDLYKTLGKL